jgi:hypothetical protein
MKLPNQAFDPKLRAAMEDIKAAMAKYDIGGFVVLQSERHMEHLIEFSPSWSCLTTEKVDGKAVAVRFKCALKTGDDKERERGDFTAGMILGSLDCLEILKKQFTQLAGMLAKHLHIEHINRQE